MNTCGLGHTSHDLIEAQTQLGKMFVYDYNKYKNNPGAYCTGQDAVSENLSVEGLWEGHDTKVIRKILEDGDRSRSVIDFGCHIGWYTIMAAQLGYTVIGIDGDNENLLVLRLNAQLSNVEDKITTRAMWIDKDTRPLKTDTDIELVKIDLEGNDGWAIASLRNIINRVQNLYIEISPVFNGGYPQLVKDLEAKGFHAFYPDNTPFDHDFSLTQINLRFSR